MEVCRGGDVAFDEHITTFVTGLVVCGLVIYACVKLQRHFHKRRQLRTSSETKKKRRSRSAEGEQDTNDKKAWELAKAKEAEAIATGKLRRRKAIAQQALKLEEKKSVEGYKLTLGDHIIGLLLIATMVVNVYTRTARGVPHWLVQPCHWLTALLIFTTYYTGRSDFYFWFYLYSSWQSYFAFIALDLSWYESQLEVWAFFVQHVLLPLAPFYFLITGRFQASRNNIFTFLAIYAFDILYHTVVLIPVGLATSTDFDNMVCPIPGSEPYVGKWWREALAIGSIPFALLVCYIPPLLIGWGRKLAGRTN